MSIWILICGILFLIIGFAFTVFDNAFGGSFFIFAGAWLASAYVFNDNDSNKPEAIDVYRGKTTLEITYRDSVAVDTVVVFKKK